MISACSHLLRYHIEDACATTQNCCKVPKTGQATVIWPDCFSRLPDCQIAFCVARLRNAIWQIWLCQIGLQSGICLCQIAKCNLAISGRLPQNASAIQFESQCYSSHQIGSISRMKKADAHLPDWRGFQIDSMCQIALNSRFVFLCRFARLAQIPDCHRLRQIACNSRLTFQRLAFRCQIGGISRLCPFGRLL